MDMRYDSFPLGASIFELQYFCTGLITPQIWKRVIIGIEHVMLWVVG